MEATDLEDKLEPGETVIQFFDDSDNIIILTRSPKTIARLKANPKAVVYREAEDDFPAFVMLPADFISFRTTPFPGAPLAKRKPTTGKTRSNKGNTDGNAYANYYFRSAFDPDK